MPDFETVKQHIIADSKELKKKYEDKRKPPNFIEDYIELEKKVLEAGTKQIIEKKTENICILVLNVLNISLFIGGLVYCYKNHNDFDISPKDHAPTLGIILFFNMIFCFIMFGIGPEYEVSIGYKKDMVKESKEYASSKKEFDHKRPHNMINFCKRNRGISHISRTMLAMAIIILISLLLATVFMGQKVLTSICTIFIFIVGFITYSVYIFELGTMWWVYERRLKDELYIVKDFYKQYQQQQQQSTAATTAATAAAGGGGMSNSSIIGLCFVPVGFALIYAIFNSELE